MVYVKNVPAWERWLRAIIGLAITGGGLAIFGFHWQALVAGLMGFMALMTGTIGFCPMCALAGRKLRQGRPQ